MNLKELQRVYTEATSYTSVQVDASRTHAHGGHELEVRWRDLATDLDRRGVAQDADLELVDEPCGVLRDGIDALLRFDSRPARSVRT